MADRLPESQKLPVTHGKKYVPLPVPGTNNYVVGVHMYSLSDHEITFITSPAYSAASLASIQTIIAGLPTG